MEPCEDAERCKIVLDLKPSVFSAQRKISFAYIEPLPVHTVVWSRRKLPKSPS